MLFVRVMDVLIAVFTMKCAPNGKSETPCKYILLPWLVLLIEHHFICIAFLWGF